VWVGATVMYVVFPVDWSLGLTKHHSGMYETSKHAIVK
jgi:hypothetical protein